MKKLLAAVAISVLLAGCGSSAAPKASSDDSSKATEKAVVFAAASLNKSFPEIVDANYSFDGSSGLVDQLKGGAKADVFASADQKNMDKAVDAGLIDGEPKMFATNYLVLVTPADNPGKITGLDDSLTGKKLVICAPDVPCGAATIALAEDAGIALNPVSEEAKVTDVLGKVTSGEADAGLVYATDATSAGEQVQTIQIDGAKEDPNTYWIAKVKDAPNPDSAEQFIAAIVDEQGAAKLAEFGFGPAK